MSKMMTKVKKTMNDMAPQALRASEVSALAFAVGMAKGKYGDKALNLWGVPGDLIAGVALHALAFSGVAGKATPKHLHAMGDGAIAAFMVGLGQRVGKRI